MTIFRLSLSVIVAAALVSAGPAAADYEVMESTVADLPRGATLPDDATVAIPEGGRVKLLQTREGTTHDLEGPYEGSVSDYEAKSDCPWYKKISVGCGGETAPIGIRSTPSPER
jgi:hypothetical protein